jgi:hypothetical protein
MQTRAIFGEMRAAMEPQQKGSGDLWLNPLWLVRLSPAMEPRPTGHGDVRGPYGASPSDPAGRNGAAGEQAAETFARMALTTCDRSPQWSRGDLQAMPGSPGARKRDRHLRPPWEIAGKPAATAARQSGTALLHDSRIALRERALPARSLLLPNRRERLPGGG